MQDLGLMSSSSGRLSTITKGQVAQLVNFRDHGFKSRSVFLSVTHVFKCVHIVHASNMIQLFVVTVLILVLYFFVCLWVGVNYLIKLRIRTSSQLSTCPQITSYFLYESFKTAVPTMFLRMVKTHDIRKRLCLSINNSCSTIPLIAKQSRSMGYFWIRIAQQRSGRYQPKLVRGD
jgi:hypothetical protein